ncbi:MAG: TonB-dependent receptor, partial [Candidatus Binatia bacterium]
MRVARIGVLVGALGATFARAQDAGLAPATEITMDRLVVTATGWESQMAETSPSISVVTGEQLERKQVTTVADALREVPGVAVSESGPRGSTTSVFLRGADSDQVLVLIDGIEVNSTTAGFFDFSNLTPENIERIEVLRGWGGTLYGSEAIGGVIQIFTRRGEGPPRGSVSAAGGNAYTDREVADVSGRSGIFSYSAAASHIRSEGFKPENDDYENTVVSGRVDADVGQDARSGVVFRLGSAEFGNFFSNNFLAAPDPNARQEDAFAAGRGEWSHRPLRNLEYRLAVSYARDDLEFRDRPDETETGSTDSDFLSEVLSGDVQSNLSWWEDAVQSIFGMEVETRSGDVDSVSSDPTFGTFASDFDRTVRTVSG